MPKFIDLTGKRFGMLVVLERCEDFIFPGGSPIAQWYCRCDCGNVIKKTSTKLKTVKNPNCGCIYDYDMLGKTFGRLKVISEASPHYTPKKKPVKMWRCRCECGNEKNISGQSLRKGLTKSCGCLANVDITGKKVGKLIVLKQVVSRAKKAKEWLCQCECGNTIIKTTAELNSEHVKTCGHCRDVEARIWGGYKWVYKPEYPGNSKGWIQEHIYIYEMEKGIKLDDKAIIHHINMDKMDNSIGNLFLCSDNFEHSNAHKSINILVKELMEDGIIKFEEGKYFLEEEGE